MALGLDWLLNKNDKEEQVVQAPAFSLTKVLAIAAPVVTIAVTVISDLVLNGGLKWSEGQVTALIIAVLGLITVTGAADLIARAMVTAAERQPAAMVTFPKAIAAKLVVDEGPQHEDLEVMGFSCEEPARFLCMRDDKLTWLPAAQVDFAIGR
jgi:hypothetical protein